MVAVVARFAEERLGLLWRDSLTRETLKLYLAKGVYCRLVSNTFASTILPFRRTFTATSSPGFLLRSRCTWQRGLHRRG